jgi:hypothetical protein
MAWLNQEFKQYVLLSNYSRENGKVIDENDQEIMTFESTWRGLITKFQSGKEAHLRTSFYFSRLRETTKAIDENRNKIGEFQISFSGKMTFITPDKKRLFCIEFIPREYRMSIYDPKINTEIASVEWYFWIDPPEKSKGQSRYDIYVYDETYPVIPLLSGICYMYKRMADAQQMP